MSGTLVEKNTADKSLMIYPTIYSSQGVLISILITCYREDNLSLICNALLLSNISELGSTQSLRSGLRVRDVPPIQYRYNIRITAIFERIEYTC